MHLVKLQPLRCLFPGGTSIEYLTLSGMRLRKRKTREEEDKGEEEEEEIAGREEKIMREKRGGGHRSGEI